MPQHADFEHRHIQVQEWEIHCAIAGQGPSVVLFHGLGASWRWWIPTINGLSNYYTLYAVDLPGAGQSSPLLFQPTGKDFLRFFEQLLHSLSLDTASIVGHSLGGYVALQAALHRAEGIKQIALVAPAGVVQIRLRMLKVLSYPFLGDILLQRLSKSGLAIVLHSLVHDPDVITEEVLEWTASSLSKSQNRKQFLFQLRLDSQIQPIRKTLDVNGQLPSSLPVKLFWGRFDPVFPIEAAFQLQKLLRCPNPVIFEQSGHIPQVEEPELFNNHLHKFLANAEDCK